jgi:hypothetical protein
VFDTKSNSPAINLSAAPNGNYFARVRGFDTAGIEGYNAVRRIDISAQNLVWIREINVAAIADHVPEGVLLTLNMSAFDTPRQMQLQVARDAGMAQMEQTLAVDASGKITLTGLKPGDKRYVRFTGTSPQGTVGSSPVLQLELPLNWGTTVLGLTSALQTPQ